jgi:hypothetical protein
VVTLLADEDVGAATPDDPAPVDEVADLPEPDEALDDEVAVWDVAADWDVFADVFGGVAAWDEPDEARTAVPAVRATATPATPAVICLTRRRARCRRVAASLVLRTASGLRFTVITASVYVHLWCYLGRWCVAAVNIRSGAIRGVAVEA